MNLIKIFTVGLFLVLCQNIFGQKLNINVQEKATLLPLQMATVRVFETKNNKLVTGNVTNQAGEISFNLAANNYYIKVDFVGFKTYQTPVFDLKNDFTLATILLENDSKLMEEVQVTGQKSTMTVEMDKRVFNVGKDLMSRGGNASDLLMNVPSVTVEPDGAIKLRGSDNVKILIDGRPSGLVSLKGGSGLNTIPASMIERVELITNPSARYEAEGMAGVINIILKKENAQGFNGSYELVGGFPINSGLGLNMNYRHKKINFFVNYGFTYRVSPNRGSLYQEVFNSPLDISQQNRTGTLEGLNNNIRGGLDFYLTDKSILTAAYLFKRSDARRLTDVEYLDFKGSLANFWAKTLRTQDETEDEPNSEYSLTYKKDFGKKDHNFTADIRFIDNWERSDQLFTQKGTDVLGKTIKNETFIQKSLNDEFEKNYVLQTDYVQPLGKNGKMELGARAGFRNMDNNYFVSQETENGTFVNLPEFTNNFDYTENITAAYGILGQKFGKLGIQTGLRAENTLVNTTLELTNEKNLRKYFNFFPTLHFSWAASEKNNFFASYSKRIRRPTYNDLSPFSTYTDSRNFFSGNPNLDPEFTNALETGFLKYLGKSNFGFTVYQRFTTDKIQGIRQVNNAGFAISRPENLNSEKSFGIEFISQMAVLKWWKVDFNFNLFQSKIDGTNVSDYFLRTIKAWNARQSSRITLPKQWEVQFRTQYEAAQKTVQGKRLPLFFMDLAISKEILKGKGNLLLNATDVFNSRKMRTIFADTNFESNGYFQYRMRQVNLTLNYRINQNKNTKTKSLIEE